MIDVSSFGALFDDSSRQSVLPITTRGGDGEWINLLKSALRNLLLACSEPIHKGIDLKISQTFFLHENWRDSEHKERVSGACYNFVSNAEQAIKGLSLVDSFFVDQSNKGSSLPYWRGSAVIDRSNSVWEQASLGTDLFKLGFEFPDRLRFKPFSAPSVDIIFILFNECDTVYPATIASQKICHAPLSVHEDLPHGDGLGRLTFVNLPPPQKFTKPEAISVESSRWLGRDGFFQKSVGKCEKTRNKTLNYLRGLESEKKINNEVVGNFSNIDSSDVIFLTCERSRDVRDLYEVNYSLKKRMPEEIFGLRDIPTRHLSPQSLYARLLERHAAARCNATHFTGLNQATQEVTSRVGAEHSGVVSIGTRDNVPDRGQRPKRTKMFKNLP